MAKCQTWVVQSHCKFLIDFQCKWLSLRLKDLTSSQFLIYEVKIHGLNYKSSSIKLCKICKRKIHLMENQITFCKLYIRQYFCFDHYFCSQFTKNCELRIYYQTLECLLMLKYVHNSNKCILYLCLFLYQNDQDNFSCKFCKENDHTLTFCTQFHWNKYYTFLYILHNLNLLRTFSSFQLLFIWFQIRISTYDQLYCFQCWS